MSAKALLQPSYLFLFPQLSSLCSAFTPLWHKSKNNGYHSLKQGSRNSARRKHLFAAQGIVSRSLG